MKRETASLVREMDSPFMKAQHYHDQAANLRKLAAMDDNEPTRKALLDLAESYEKLAKKFLNEGGSAGADKS